MAFGKFSEVVWRSITFNCVSPSKGWPLLCSSLISRCDCGLVTHHTLGVHETLIITRSLEICFMIALTYIETSILRPISSNHNDERQRQSTKIDAHFEMFVRKKQAASDMTRSNKNRNLSTKFKNSLEYSYFIRPYHFRELN